MTNIPTVVNPRAPKRMVGCELLNLAAHNPADLVQLSAALMPLRPMFWHPAAVLSC